MGAQPAAGKVPADQSWQESPEARRPADHHTQPARAEVSRATQEVESSGREKQQAEGRDDSDVAWHRQQQQQGQ